MIRLDNREPIPETLRGAIIALGNFDGFHLGHQAVVGEAIAWARAEGRPAIVATFDPHPVRLFVPEAAVGSNQDRKILWLVGPDDLVSAQEVTVGQKLGTWVAVTAADPSRPLTTTDRVVIRGLQRCREGKPVTPLIAADKDLDRASLVAPAPPAPPEPPGLPAPPAAAEPLPVPAEASP